MIENKSFSRYLFIVCNYTLLAILALLCVAPFVNLLALSFSDRSAALGGFVTFWPVHFTTAAYDLVLRTGGFYTSFYISVVRTVLGTAVGMFVTILTAYPMSRTEQEFKGRGVLTWILLFAMLFSGGLIPWWLTIRHLGMLNSIWALVIPSALSIWNVILLMNFFREIPRELDDAASIDGASHWTRLFRIYVPLSAPALATLTLFTAVGHWNSWFDGMVLMTDVSRYPLQTFLRTIVVSSDLSNMAVGDPSKLALLSDRSLKAANIFLATLPILIVYPILQRYFVAGIKLGAVKG